MYNYHANFKYANKLKVVKYYVKMLSLGQICDFFTTQAI